jgi:thiol-disulfide isomerase/thioredoxin
MSRLVTGFVLITSLASAQMRDNNSAPEIVLDKLIPDQPVEKATLKALKGKAIVMEFWATWCGPCVAEIPHLNELAARFRDRPIQFLSITQQRPVDVEWFLSNHPIGGWVGISRPLDRRVSAEEVFDGGEVRVRLPNVPHVFKEYRVRAIPQTVLIDANGRIVARTAPRSVNANVLEDLLAGRPVDAPAFPRFGPR